MLPLLAQEIEMPAKGTSVFIGMLVGIIFLIASVSIAYVYVYLPKYMERNYSPKMVSRQLCIFLGTAFLICAGVGLVVFFIVV
jgi:hypothetical protein